MGMLGEYHEGDVWPDFGTVLLTDIGPSREVADAVHGPSGWGSTPLGTLASSGPGWVAVGASDGPYALRVEVHDTAPATDLDGWDTAVELPYRSVSGLMGIGGFADPPTEERLTFTSPGEYRVRVLHTYPATPEHIDDEEEGDLLVQFWRAEPEPPRWLRRKFPAVGWAADDGGLTTVEDLGALPEVPATPADLSRVMEQAGHDSFSALAGDLVLIALCRRRPWTISALAERVLATETDVRAALDWAVREGKVRVDGEFDGEFGLERRE